MNPTTINISLSEDQVALLESVKYCTEKLLALQNASAYLTEKEAAERLKISLTTIRQWRGEGWLRYFAEGANIRYRTDYLDADFESRAIVKAPLQPNINQFARKR